MGRTSNRMLGRSKLVLTLANVGDGDGRAILAGAADEGTADDVDDDEDEDEDEDDDDGSTDMANSAGEGSTCAASGALPTFTPRESVAAMSARTAGVAVAVTAAKGTPGKA